MLLALWPFGFPAAVPLTYPFFAIALPAPVLVPVDVVPLVILL